MVQITQTLSTRVKASHGFEMPVIYIPEKAMKMSGTHLLPQNGLPELAELLQKKLGIKVQDNLTKFKLDIQMLKKGAKSLK